MGSLKALGEYWLLGKRTYQELASIAREVLVLDVEPQVTPILPTRQSSNLEEAAGYNFPMIDDSFDFYNFYNVNFTSNTTTSHLNNVL